ncbi:hypothetical protein ER57_00625 [Smithella sp. SCADC]|nr:hypothetical protein ER57_00625 [Smithella sp. SCADC]
MIFDHIAEHEVLDKKDAYDKAETIAFRAVNSLIDDLEVNTTNYKRIKEYISSYHSFSAFNRLHETDQMEVY